MAELLCPPWLGYFLISPLRKIVENPYKMLDPFIEEGMTILEPGCGMGYFTIPIAKMAGENGRTIAVDIQGKMISVLRKKSNKAGLSERIETILITENRLSEKVMKETVDLCVLIHMLHEVSDQILFFQEIHNILKPEGRILLIEPKGHVSKKSFEQSINKAKETGFLSREIHEKIRGHKVLLTKNIS